MIGTTEAVIIGGVFILLFGASRLPELARGVGEARRELHDAMDDAPSPDTTPLDPSTTGGDDE